MIFIIQGFQTIVFIFIVIYPNVSADTSSGLQVFLELKSLHGTLYYVLYLIHGGRWFS